MGQTLTHGIYLPDEGERNCYDGLAANWQLLDGAVGTIAEHTTALAGKAPLVHTHSKADVTDLLNSNFIPSANNSYDLGSSIYQWNNLYAKNYYYNGTQWGLDKDNTWSKCQNFAGEYQGTEASNKYHTVFAIYSKYDTLGKSGMLFTKWRENKAQGALTSSDLVQIGIDVLENEVRTNHVFNIQAGVFDSETGLCNTCNVISRMANANLGTSSYKWKTLNGINPGALSLPNSPGGTGTENVNYFDLSGNITVRDGHTFNRYTAPCDGWIAIGTFATWLQISNDTLILATTANPGADGFAQAFLPVRKGNSIRIVINQTNTQYQSFKLLPCEGNV